MWYFNKYKCQQVPLIAPLSTSKEAALKDRVHFLHKLNPNQSDRDKIYSGVERVAIPKVSVVTKDAGVSPMFLDYITHLLQTAGLVPLSSSPSLAELPTLEVFDTRGLVIKDLGIDA